MKNARSNLVCGRGFSLVEVIVAAAIAGGLLVAALTAVGATARTRRITQDRATALTLARDLMDEIAATVYEDATGNVGMGTEAGEALSRSLFDDVDDYAGYKDEPPSSPDGEVYDLGSGWKRTVAVAYASDSDVSADSASDQGVKRVTVTVTRRGAPILSLTALRTRAWDALVEGQQ